MRTSLVSSMTDLSKNLRLKTWYADILASAPVYADLYLFQSDNGGQPSWRSLVVYFGGLTFDPTDPANYLRIPNRVAARRIAHAVLKRYKLSQSLVVALQQLSQDGDIERLLGCYRDLITQRDITWKQLTDTSEQNHRDAFYSCLLQNHNLHPRLEFPVIKVFHWLIIWLDNI